MFAQIPARHMDERVLKLSVVDNERGKHHNVIGHALFPLSQLDWACGENTLVTWKDLDKHGAQPVSGHIPGGIYKIPRSLYYYSSCMAFG